MKKTLVYNTVNGDHALFHVTDDVTWPWKVKVMTPMHLEANILKMVGDSDLVTIERLQEIGTCESNDDDVISLYGTDYILSRNF